MLISTVMYAHLGMMDHLMGGTSNMLAIPKLPPRLLVDTQAQCTVYTMSPAHTVMPARLPPLLSPC